MVTPAINSDINTSTDYLDLQIKGKNIAKALAIDLNSNEEHRKEVFTRIANKFDGDYNILVSHLSDETIKEIEQRIKTTANKKSGLNISSSDNYIKQIVREEPKLQLMMPYAESWTDEKIEQADGLIVAYYPFGVDDKKVKEITGYDKNGNEIKITKQTAARIPYIILTINERTDDDGYLKTSGKKQKSIYGIDPKEIAMDNKTTDWKRTSINSLRNKNLNPTINVVPEEEEGGGGGGGIVNPPATPTKMFVSEFLCQNVSDYEEYWIKGEPEFFIKIHLFAFSGEIAGNHYSFSAFTFKLLGPINYDGYFSWSGHVYRNDWRNAGDPSPRLWSDATYSNLTSFGNPPDLPLLCPPFQVYVYEEDTFSDDYVGESYFNYTDNFPIHVWVNGTTAINVLSVP